MELFNAPKASCLHEAVGRHLKQLRRRQAGGRGLVVENLKDKILKTLHFQLHCTFNKLKHKRFQHTGGQPDVFQPGC